MNSDITQNIPSPVGYLVVHVTTANGAIPLEGARVEIRPCEEDGTESPSDVMMTVLSDRNGNTEKLTLSTKQKAESLSPSKEKPFLTYSVKVIKEGYYLQTFVGLAIFEGITGVQPANLIPLPERGNLSPFGEEILLENEFPEI